MTAIDISPQKDGGVLKEIIKEGVGNDLPSHGSKVTVHYTGTLLDGTKFDSSKDRNEPFEFDLGRRSVIKAWDIGVATMKQGEVAMLTCAPAYAYGKNGSPPKIPPDSTLKFEIEMLGWKGEDLSPNQDGSIERFRLTAGKELSNSEKGAIAKVHLIGKYNGREFDNRELEFPLGEGEIHGVIEGVEIALLHFSDQEKSRLKIKSKYAFGKTGKPEFDIPPDADVEYEVKVHSIEKTLDVWSLQPEEKVKQAQIVKEKGTTYFKNNQFRAAIEMYKRILELLKYQEDFKDDIKKEVDNLTLSAHLNLALCYLKTDQNAEAKQESNEALKLSPQNEKALFRRGQAYLRLASPEMAMKDFQEVLKIQPKNTAAAKEIIVCNNLIKKYLEKEKKLYANMFDKFAEEDKQKEEEKLRQQPDVMRGTLGEWGQEERPGGRDATAFEKENPNILMLNANGTGEFQNM